MSTILESGYLDGGDEVVRRPPHEKRGCDDEGRDQSGPSGLPDRQDRLKPVSDQLNRTALVDRLLFRLPTSHARRLVFAGEFLQPGADLSCDAPDALRRPAQAASFGLTAPNGYAPPTHQQRV